MPNHSPPSDSLSKKRARDLRAQNNLRQRRAAHIATLEERVTNLQDELSRVRAAYTSLQKENQVFRARQKQAFDLVEAWANEDATLVANPQVYHSLVIPNSSIWPKTRGQSLARGSNSAATNSYLGSFSSQPSCSQPWTQTPAHSDNDIIAADCFNSLFQSRHLAVQSPDVPQPIELLFGSRTNFLANTLHQLTREWPCRDPERLACGWLAYHMIKWMMQPTEASFSRLVDFQKPVLDQIQCTHPFFVDFMVWPALRTCLVNTHRDYCKDDFVGMMGCCQKVRWPWNKPILLPDDDGKLVFDADFYRTFTSLDGWGLTQEFIDKFPRITEYLDASQIQYKFV
ncbi:hypothetical protein FOMA001_g13289 [Fusarium oxysporum f. sp. matthiolae]|nr:hypothetical protein FOMA001_g13289 [Fusarium oxysporum f. sp. matthiolae]